MSRKPISNSIRFEVFKRDSFTCQYCGSISPDVVLNVDHIHPVAGGGENDILNLVTSCFKCNSGKSDRSLDDKSIIERQRKQLDDLNERRLQMEMMVQWREAMLDIKQKYASQIAESIAEIGGYSPNETGEANIKCWLRKYTYEELIDAVDTSFGQYMKFKDDGRPDVESWGKAFAMVPRIAAIKKSGGLSSDMSRIFYIRGILRNRLSYINEKTLISRLKEAVSVGVDVEMIMLIAKTSNTWSSFWADVEDKIHDAINGKDI